METFDRLKRILVDCLGINESTITLEAGLIDDLGADSLDVVEVVMDVESEFGIIIHDDDIERFVTVRDVVLQIDQSLITTTHA